MKKDTMTKFFIMLGLVIVGYIPTFIWMYQRWNEKDTYYSHGILIPFICAFLIWQRRALLAKIKEVPVKFGWVLFGVGIVIHAMSALLQVYFTSGFSLMLVIPGLVLIFFGKETLRKVGFTIAFLVFMIPLPLVAIANISFQLKIFASKISTAIVNGIGVAAIRDGSIIRTAHSFVVVEDPCSGIRSLISLIALGALMAYFSPVSKTKKTILFISAIPIAVVSNIIRIVALTLVSEMYGARHATGWFHDTMGILVFVFAFLGLSLVAKTLE